MINRIHLIACCLYVPISVVCLAGCHSDYAIGHSTEQGHAGIAVKSLRILAYNIKHGRGNDNVVDLSRAAAIINELKADLVALQEIDNGTRRTDGVDQAKRLGELTGMHHAFGSFFDYDGGEYGMAILSRYPLKEVTNHRLPAGSEPRTSLAVVVQPFADGPEVVFVGVHFYQTAEQRLAQAARLLEVLGDETRPVIVAGDFNSRPDSPVLELFATDWTIPDKGEDHLTFSSDRPRIEIDYLMFRPREAFIVKQIDVLDEPVVSDHRPVLMDVTVQE